MAPSLAIEEIPVVKVHKMSSDLSKMRPLWISWTCGWSGSKPKIIYKYFGLLYNFGNVGFKIQSKQTANYMVILITFKLNFKSFPWGNIN